MLLEPSVSPPSPWFHSLAATAGVRKKKKKKKKSYVKASQSESNHWPSTTMIGLITVRQMQLARHSYKILQQEIHSVPFNLSFKKWQHCEKTGRPEATVTYKNEIHRGCHSNADPYNHNKRLPANLYLQSSLNFTEVIISVSWAPCWFLTIVGNQHKRELNVLCFSKSEFWNEKASIM